MSDKPLLPPSGSHEVGYGKLPKDKRFKKGQSGNPLGRPKGSKNKPPVTLERLKSILVSEAYREVEILDKTGPVSMPVAQAAMRAPALKAARGQVGAQKLFLSSLSTFEGAEKREHLKVFDDTKAYQKRMRSVIEAHLDRGEETPEMLPHPDDIELDLETGEVIFHGPVTSDDKQIWISLHHHKESHEEEIEGLKSLIQLLENRDKVTLELEGFGEADDVDSFVASLKTDLEVLRFILITTCLSIMRRWSLRAKCVTDSFVLGGLLDQHIADGTDPKKPETLKSKPIDWEKCTTESDEKNIESGTKRGTKARRIH